MARKMSITVGLSVEVVDALGDVQLQLYKKALEEGSAVLAGSRSELVELLLREALKARGIDFAGKADSPA